MPLLLLTLLIALTGCKKSNNEIVGTNFDKKVYPAIVEQNKLSEEIKVKKLDERPQFVLAHGTEKSILRNKLIERLINRELKTNVTTLIEEQDEFKFSDDLSRDQFEIKEFQNKSKENARVLVSYAGNVFAYLVPENLPIKELVEILKLNSEEGRTLITMSQLEGLTKAGQVFYFLSVKHEDLIAHDRLSYFQAYRIDTKSATHNLRLSYGQVADMVFQTQYFVQTVNAQQFNGQPRKCLRDEAEAGLCEACTFYREIPTAEFKIFPEKSLNELGFEFSFGGKKLNANELGIEYFKDHFNLKFDTNNFIKAEDGEIEFSFNFNPSAQTVTTKDYNFTERCQSKNANARIDSLQTKVLSTYSVRIWGRGILLKTIKLK